MHESLRQGGMHFNDIDWDEQKKKRRRTYSTRTRFFLHIFQIITQFSGSGGACEHSINNDVRTSSRLSLQFVLMRDNSMQFSSKQLQLRPTNIDLPFRFWRVFSYLLFLCSFIRFDLVFFFVCDFIAFYFHNVTTPAATMYSQRRFKPKHKVVECHKKVGTSFVEKL